MAYDANNLSALTYANGFTLWHYKTADAASAVDAGGYFDGAANMLRVGDFVFVNTSIGATVGSSVMIVASNSGGSVDLTSITS